MSADSELSAKLNRRLDRHEALESGQAVTNQYRTTGISLYTEFSEFSRQQIKEYEKSFKKYYSMTHEGRCQIPDFNNPVLRYDAGGDGYLDLSELKVTMERLGAPQTHLSLKTMIKEVDEDQDGKLSFRELSHGRPTSHRRGMVRTWRLPRRIDDDDGVSAAGGGRARDIYSIIIG